MANCMYCDILNDDESREYYVCDSCRAEDKSCPTCAKLQAENERLRKLIDKPIEDANEMFNISVTAIAQRNEAIERAERFRAALNCPECVDGYVVTYEDNDKPCPACTHIRNEASESI